MLNGRCRECPNNCHWSRHVSNTYRYETQYETVEKEYDEIRERFETAVEGMSNVEAIIEQVEEDFNDTNHTALKFVAEMQPGLKKLSEIALKKDSLEDTFNLLIESEKLQAKPGWQNRVNALQKTLDAAVQINRLGKPGFYPWNHY